MDKHPKPNSLRQVDLTQLPHLPHDQRLLLQYIMRKGEVSANALYQQRPNFLRNDEHVSALLSALQTDGLLEVIEHPDSETVSYRVKLKPRREKATMRGIWQALDTAPKLLSEQEVAPDVRRTRSQTTDRLLAALDTPSKTSPPPASPPASASEQTDSAQGLMDALFSTGRRAMQNPATDDSIPPDAQAHD